MHHDITFILLFLFKPGNFGGQFEQVSVVTGHKRMKTEKVCALF